MEFSIYTKYFILSYQLQNVKKVNSTVKYKNIHLINENTFANNLYYELVRSDRLKNNLFVIIDGGKHSEFFTEQQLNIVKVKYTDIDSYSLNVELLKYLNESENIFIHFLSENICNMLNTHLLGKKKIYWMIFGGDLYPFINQELYSEETKKIMESMNLNFKFNLTPTESRLKLVNSLTGALTWIKYDYFLAKEFLDLNADLIHFNYPFGKISVKSKEKKRSVKSLKILLGNSGTPENNHIDIMNFLRDYLDEIDTVYLPLAYGNLEYINVIKEMGYSIFGDKLVPILDFMEFEKYIEIIDKCDLIFMNHFRQQGAGNIIIALELGKIVYINSFVTTYKTFEDYGINIYPLDELLDNDKKINSLFELIKHFDVDEQYKLVQKFRKSFYDNYYIFD